MLISFVCGIVIFICSALANTDSIKELYTRIPESLTIETFDNNLKSGFHLIEFFSPNCHHCVNLLPTWVDLYEKHATDNSINIRQVNCLVNGDLCDRESIQYYPTIRFYGPESKLLGSFTNSERTIDTFDSYIDEQLINWGEDLQFENGINPIFSKNRLLSGLELANILSGDQLSKPMLISFWPSTDDDLNDSNFQSDQKSTKFFQYLPSCYLFRNIWNLTLKSLSDLVLADELSLTYFNCKENSSLCKSLGFYDLIEAGYDGDTVPKVALILPDKNGGNMIHYRLKNTELQTTSINNLVKTLTHWAKRLVRSSKVEYQSFTEIQNLLNAKAVLNPVEKISAFEDYSKIGFVLVNDPQSAVPEDDLIFHHLLQEIADLPTDAYLLKTGDIDQVKSFLERQEKSLTEKYINLVRDEDEEPSIFDEELFISKTHTTYPFLLCIKSGSLISTVYQAFQSNDMRSYEKLSKFIKQNSLPIIDRLSTDNVKTHFPEFNKAIHSKGEKVVITLTDFQAKDFFKSQFYMSFVYHKFQYLNQKFQFAKTILAREKKAQKVKNLKDQNADSVDIIGEMKKSIDSAFQKTDNSINMVYLDIKEWPLVVSQMQWSDIQPNDYVPGDSIIISKFQNSYWDKSKEKKISQSGISETVNLMKDVSFRNLKGNSLNSIFWLWLFLFYICLAFGFIFAIKVYQKRSHSHHLKKERLKPLGLLGLNPANSSKSD